MKQLNESTFEDSIELRLHKVKHARALEILNAIPWGQKAAFIVIAIENALRVNAAGEVELVARGDAAPVALVARIESPKSVEADSVNPPVSSVGAPAPVAPKRIKVTATPM